MNGLLFNGKKMETFLIKIGNAFAFERNIFNVSYLKSKKRETYDANDLLALSLISIIVYIYSLGIILHILHI